MDTALFYWINSQFQSRMMTAFMLFVSDPKHFLVPGILTASFIIWIYSWRGACFILATLAVLLIGDAFCYKILKPLFDRPRPCAALADAIFYSRCSGNGSFPSNHASNIFTLATLFGVIYRNTRLFAFFIAALVGFSRIYLGMHYPSDVLGGALIGILMGLSGVWIYNKLAGKLTVNSTP